MRYSQLDDQTIVVLAQSLVGDAQHAFVRQIAEEQDVRALRALHRAGLFNVDEKRLLHDNPIEVKQRPVMSARSLPLIDALADCITKYTYKQYDDPEYEISKKQWNVQRLSVRVLDVAPEFRETLVDVLVDVARQMDHVVANRRRLVEEEQEQALQQASQDAPHSDGEALYYDEIPDPVEPGEADWQPPHWNIRLETRDATMCVMLALACACDDVELLRKLAATEGGQDWLSRRPSQYEYTNYGLGGAWDKKGSHGTEGKWVEFCGSPTAWALEYSSTNVLKWLKENAPASMLVSDVATIHEPGHAGAETWLDAGEFLAIRSGAPEREMAGLLFEAMVSEAQYNIKMKRWFSNFLLEEMADRGNGRWCHLVDAAGNAGMYSLDPSRAAEVAIRHWCAPMLSFVVDEMRIDGPTLAQGSGNDIAGGEWPPGHPLQAMLTQWSPSRPEPCRQCLEMLLDQMHERGMTATLFGIHLVATTDRDPFGHLLKLREVDLAKRLMCRLGELDAQDPCVLPLFASMTVRMKHLVAWLEPREVQEVQELWTAMRARREARSALDDFGAAASMPRA